MDDGIVLCLGLALGVVALALSVITLNPYAIAIASISLLLALAAYKLWYVIEPLILKKTNIIQVIGDYELSGSRNSALRSTTKCFCATAAAALDPPKTDIERDRIEEVISHTNVPFKFILQLERLDSKRICERLQTKRAMKEIALSKLNGGESTRNAQKIRALKREIEQLEQDIDAISSGSSPVRLAQYILCSAYAENRYLAEEKARLQLRDISGQFGALIGSQPRALEGSELIRLLGPDSMVS